MKKGFVKQTSSGVELQEVIPAFERAGVAADQIIVEESFETFASGLQRGDTVVIQSYLDIFSSMNEFFVQSLRLVDRGIDIESLAEPAIVMSDDSAGFIRGLYELGGYLRKHSTCQGLMKAKAEGKRLGRPVGTTKLDQKVQQVIELRKSGNISVLKACEIAGCNPRGYYRYLGKK